MAGRAVVVGSWNGTGRELKYSNPMISWTRSSTILPKVANIEAGHENRAVPVWHRAPGRARPPSVHVIRNWILLISIHYPYVSYLAYTVDTRKAFTCLTVPFSSQPYTGIILGSYIIVFVGLPTPLLMSGGCSRWLHSVPLCTGRMNPPLP